MVCLIDCSVIMEESSTNDEVMDMAENFNVEIKTTAAYSLWSNGLMEQHNQTH